MSLRATLIAFLLTSTTLLLASQLVAEPGADRAKLLDLVDAQMGFEPEVADPTAGSEAIDLGHGLTASLTPVDGKDAFEVDVVLENRGQRAATANLRLDCYGESFEPMGRVARPVSVLVAKRRVKARLRSGDKVVRHLRFQPKRGQHPTSARVSVTHGGVTAKDVVFLAMGERDAPVMLQPLVRK